ncbi:protein kinase [Agrobacterium tumefaciens]|uniref:protein kinase domain-containing protein n=1 Tax=Agrobacterium tumefaciens TaxID=358 RepID=UPI0021D0AD46|nr:protein kinase [Agrobacterium tumefaciens]UXS12092.1 protein kinase [Agrobacterium tumefaciens]UXS19460.1 protein kinase [Agrobacterium tumefaciens]UXT68157.1 protein kinase [Agrobacterium tumefaciens]
MSKGKEPADGPAYPQVAERFSDLWQSIRHDGIEERSAEDQKDLIDQVRNALDRKVSHFSEAKPEWIADSFSLERIAYKSENTLLLQVRHRDLGSLHALKTLPPALRNDAALLQRLREEAQVGLTLRHPCLVETSALLRLPDGRPGLLQPWLPQSLASLRPVTASHTVTILRRLLEGLCAMHARGYVHCDVTPANILLESDDFETARLGDFGIALEIGQRHAERGMSFAASREFAAPERMRDAAAKPDQDIFSVGRLARRLAGSDGARATQSLADFADACCYDNPALRPQSAMEALQLL